MKRIYNKVHLAAMAALMLTITTACTADNEPMQDNDTPQTGRPVTITATHPGAGTQDGTDAQTRTIYVGKPDGGMGVAWEKGDKIYISNYVQSPGTLDELKFEEFTLEGEGGKTTGTFTNASSKLVMSAALYAVYGKKDKINITYDRGSTNMGAKFDLTGQCQKKNDDMEHLADYDFMKDKVDNSNSALEFIHTAALVKFNLTLPENGLTVNKLTMNLSNSTGNPYVHLCTKYTYYIHSDNMLTNSSTFEVSSSSEITLGEGSGFKCETAQLTVYMMVLKRLYSSSEAATATIKVTDIDNKTYSGEVKGITAFDAGKFYTITASLTEQQ